jgi:1-hydroxycarotenoid 3,4-desaturase
LGLSRERVVVVGAGIGGLACAIDLASRGLQVTVVEKAAGPGGKMREALVGDARVDCGPTVLTMRWVFEALFAAAGEALEDHLPLHRCEVLARHAWGAQERLDLFADIPRSADAIAQFAGPAERDGYLAFCTDSRAIYETLRDTFMTAQQTGPVGLAARVGLGRAPSLMSIRPFDTMWKALGGYFRDPRLRQLFGRYATYCGSSPFQAPATLMLIAHVEQAGVWTVDGGMQRLADALDALARRLGVTFRYDAPVQHVEVEGGRACGVVLEDGDRIAADSVVLNADPNALTVGAFGEAVRRAVTPAERETRSLSAVTWALRAQTSGFPLERHNVFFSGDYAAEFDDLFGRGRLPAAPTIYVCAQDRPAASTGPERLFILVNAPARGDQAGLDPQELAACETKVLDHLARAGLTLRPTGDPPVITTPRDFNTLFPATGGALYGRATHGWNAAFQKPGAATRIPGLYLAGGGAHPGAGVPMAALSGRLAAARLIQDLGSAHRSVRGAIVGGISTPSAPMAGTASP